MLNPKFNKAYELRRDTTMGLYVQLRTSENPEWAGLDFNKIKLCKIKSTLELNVVISDWFGETDFPYIETFEIWDKNLDLIEAAKPIISVEFILIDSVL